MPLLKRRSAIPAGRRGSAFRRLPLGSLRVFVATAEELSFTRAAQSLGVTAAAVSMQIRALEEYLQAPLFHRRGRLVQLTAEGERLLPRIRSGLDELERALDETRRQRQCGPLTVSTIASLLQQWLLPRLPDFQQKHTDIDMRVHTSAELVDFMRSDVLVAIRFGFGNWGQLHTEKLLDEWLLPVCAPALLKKYGPVTTEADLKRYRLLHSTSEPWRAWTEGASAEEEWAPSGSSFDDSVSVIRAAEAGQGLALARWSLAAIEIAAGRLAIASRVIIPSRRAYYFVCPPRYLDIEKVAKFRDWLFRQAKAADRPPGC